MGASNRGSRETAWLGVIIDHAGWRLSRPTAERYREVCDHGISRINMSENAPVAVGMGAQGGGCAPPEGYFIVLSKVNPVHPIVEGH